MVSITFRAFSVNVSDMYQVSSNVSRDVVKKYQKRGFGTGNNITRMQSAKTLDQKFSTRFVYNKK